MELTDNELRNLHCKKNLILNCKEAYEIMYGEKGNEYSYLGMTFEAYGNLYFFRNVNTDECISIFMSIGD